MRFAFYETDKMIGLDEPYKGALGDFIRDENGRVEYFRIGGRALQKDGITWNSTLQPFPTNRFIRS